jgi:CopG family nickel-responsive transcriptional regulator
MSEIECERQGSITVVYDNRQRDVWPSLERIQQRFRTNIRASFRASMNENTALEFILIQGNDARIKALLEQLKSRKGVRSVDLTVISAS